MFFQSVFHVIMYVFFHIFFISLVTAGGTGSVFLWNKEACLGYCIVFLLYDFKSCNTVIIHFEHLYSPQVVEKS